MPGTTLQQSDFGHVYTQSAQDLSWELKDAVDEAVQRYIQEAALRARQYMTDKAVRIRVSVEVIED